MTQRSERGTALTIQVARWTADLDDVRAVLRDFVGWHRSQHQEDLALVDVYVDQDAAIGLYRRLGFVPTDPDPELPEDLRTWLRFFELRL